MTYAPAWQGLAPAELLRPTHASPLPFPLGADRSTYFYRARNAIYHLARSLRVERRDPILVPDYHHGNEVAALRAAGMDVKFYPIRRDFSPDLDALERLCRSGASALFVIHYLGWPQPLDAMEAMCRRHDLPMIEDCALSLLSEDRGAPLGSRGDYAIYCLYKTLPVPNGGLLMQNSRVRPWLDRPSQRPCSRAAVAGRGAELMLEWLRGYADPVGMVFTGAKRAAGRALSAFGVRREPVGDTGFSVEDSDLAMSSLCHRLIRRLDYESIRAKRRANFERLRGALEGRVVLPRSDLPEGMCPLFFPLLVSDKQAASRQLLHRGIGNVEFWNQGDAEAKARMTPDVRWLRSHVLEIPIHQGIGASHLDYMARQVLALGSLVDPGTIRRSLR
ncbi:MAG TPA: aminotransferase class I/II-fold pyridoxal phosphate-dependent enzyme [Patescibacteria group bacterium]|nr:aminotransferase class I/II-fold pyridoxal phosphate-dependent enzyme [Patescibacteria group bacterium]